MELFIARGVDNLFVVVKRPTKFFNIFLSCLRQLTFFHQQKKVSKKCRSQTPRGLHSANRFYENTTWGGLHSWDATKMSAARRTRALCDGFDQWFFAMTLSEVIYKIK
ncbi:MAG: hypothetical protein OXH16_16835 [Gemmatimonadetes bacterium]|nr:hypothetical protein [Gemmatimonadota bacterium]